MALTREKRAKLMKDERYKLVLSNLKKIAETMKSLKEFPNTIMKWYNTALKEEKAQLKFKQALETGDEVTFTVEDIESGADDDMGMDEDFDGEFEDEGGPEDIVEIEKEMKKAIKDFKVLKAKEEAKKK